MSFQIGAIAVYNREGEARILPLEVGTLNIITGASQTGKTALMDIVDYCLGSSKCNVAVGAIRGSVAHYALRLVLDDKEALVVRAAPAAGQATSTAFMIEVGRAIDVPDHLDFQSNANLEGAAGILRDLVGIGQNQFVPALPTRNPLTASIDHALWLCFQQQDEIVSRHLLFHSQGEDFHPQALKDSLPYFLGALDEEHVAKRNQMRDLTRRANRLKRSIQERESLSGSGTGRAGTLVLEAVDVGLIEAAPVFDTNEDAVAILKNLLSRGVGEMAPPADEDEYDRLLRERENLRLELGGLRAELDLVRRLHEQGEAFTGESTEQKARLASLDLIPAVNDTAVCPLCSQDVPHLSAAVSELRAQLDFVQQELAATSRDLPGLASEKSRLESRIDEVRVALRSNTDEMESLQRERAHLADLRDEYARRAHVLGRVSLFLESDLDAVEDIDENELTRVLRVLEALRTELDQATTADLLTSILSRLSISMTQWAKELHLEHSPAPFRLDLNSLMVVADTEDGPVRMDQMGSGENWLGCHLLAHFALHEWFVNQGRPVPRFLFLDQPSQVYFPAERDLDEGVVPDEDVESVRNLFDFIIKRSHALGPKFQVIVTEHADLEDVQFQNAVVEKWRQGAALIPVEWLN